MRTSLQIDSTTSNKLGVIAKYHRREKKQQIDVFIDSEIDKLDLKKAKTLDLSDAEKIALKSMGVQN